MAGFKTHITVSSLLGVGYGGAAYAMYAGFAGAEYEMYGAPLPSAILAGGLCGISGMLPDLDSGPGIPLRESVAFAAAVVPMHMVDRFAQLGWSNESMVLAGAAVYLLIRFGLASLLRHFTVHRGMFHSLPAALVAGEIAFLLASGDVGMRLFKSGAVVLGFMSHLVLDEIYSVEWRLGRVRLKSSFGTAVKLWGHKAMLPNLITYSIVGVLTFAIVNDPTIVSHDAALREFQQIAEGLRDRLR
jgi:hypothetical protein